MDSAAYVDLENRHLAHNYHPLDVVIASAEGAWVVDVDGRRYLDALAGYSALNFGHRHPRLVDAAIAQLGRVTLTSRAFRTDQLGPFARDLAALTGKQRILPMNSGAEAVETALKTARRWGEQVKGVPAGMGEIIVMDGNFHGRTTTIISFSTDPDARDGFGPYTPGFVTTAYGDLDALRELVTDRTVAVLLEPIQGEAGVVIPPEGFLRGVRQLCTERRLLMIADEIQSGLARTGLTFACDHEQVVPDIYVLGKALGGGIVALSAIAADDAVLDVLTPGSHGSTFGGNPLAAAIGREVVAMLATGEFQHRAAALGARLGAGLEGLVGHGVVGVRYRGLWAGVDIDPHLMSGKELCRRMAAHGVLAKDTHGSTIRLAPPLVATETDIDTVVAAVDAALRD
ncbi:MAG: ornithine--oxo-acid transaminase [Propionibacterium sp.]|nr:ornithine--oxo-acid transaminase [Propionibacterium sp.]